MSKKFIRFILAYFFTFTVILCAFSFSIAASYNDDFRRDQEDARKVSDLLKADRLEVEKTLSSTRFDAQEEARKQKEAAREARELNLKEEKARKKLASDKEISQMYDSSVKGVILIAILILLAILTKMILFGKAKPLKNNIYLVGFMGTGKTAVGSALAKKKNWRIVDLDEMIEARENRRISEIFTKEGELFFRKIEKEVLREISFQKYLVVSCGGGIVIDPENIKLMKETGKLIALCADVDTILKRTSGSKHRPLLNVENPREKIESLLKIREPFYLQADKVIDTSKLSIEEVVSKIMEF